VTGSKEGIEMDDATKDLPAEGKSRVPATEPGAMSPLESLRREVDRLFEDFRPAGWRLPLTRPSAFEVAWPRAERWPVVPAMDMTEKEKAYEVTAELPGMTESDVEVKLSNGNLSIRGEKREENEEKDKDKDKDLYVSERSYGAFHRLFRLPDDVDADGIEAEFRNGVLKVTLPKSPAARKEEKKIDVKAR
jgi:HSP20 family protein